MQETFEEFNGNLYTLANDSDIFPTAQQDPNGPVETETFKEKERTLSPRNKKNKNVPTGPDLYIFCCEYCEPSSERKGRQISQMAMGTHM